MTLRSTLPSSLSTSSSAQFWRGTGPAEVAALLRGVVGEGGAPLVSDDALLWATAELHVRPALLSTDEGEYVAFYDHRRWLTVGARRHGDSAWWYTQLDSRVGWDSHNYVELGVDRTRRLHVAGNMHASPLNYFRSERPGDARTLRRMGVMVREEWEQRVTYPRFVSDSEGRISFWFREGYSGNGVQRLYTFDEERMSWQAPVDGPIFDGEGRRSAYFDGNAPILGPDGNFHAVWVWRDSPDAESTHTVCYARSKDLVSWFALDGSALSLPVRLSSESSAVDPVPAGSGLINNNVKLGFDGEGRPLIIGHLRDANGKMQLVMWSTENNSWSRRQLTDWNLAWNFSGRGSLDFEIEIGRPILRDGGIEVDVRYRDRVARLQVGTGLQIRSSPLPWSGITGVVGDDGLGYFFVPDGGVTERARARYLMWRSVAPRRDIPSHEGSVRPMQMHLLTFGDEPW
ncbi:BNR repeat-containing protein [Cellulomonas hominis]